MSSRPALAAAVAAVTIALAPAAAHADDAAIKAAMPAAFTALAKKERAASTAIQHFNKNNKATRADRRKIWAVAAAVKNFRTLLAAQQPSTPAGASAQKALLAALKLELTATERIDLAMKSAGRDSIAHTNKIVARANKTLRRSSRAAAAAIKKIQAL